MRRYLCFKVYNTTQEEEEEQVVEPRSKDNGGVPLEQDITQVKNWKICSHRDPVTKLKTIVLSKNIKKYKNFRLLLKSLKIKIRKSIINCVLQQFLL